MANRAASIILDSLTPRECQVLACILEDLERDEIATRLDIETDTVDFHLANLFRKLGLATETAVVRRKLAANLYAEEFYRRVGDPETDCANFRGARQDDNQPEERSESHDSGEDDEDNSEEEAKGGPLDGEFKDVPEDDDDVTVPEKPRVIVIDVEGGDGDGEESAKEAEDEPTEGRVWLMRAAIVLGILLTTVGIMLAIDLSLRSRQTDGPEVMVVTATMGPMTDTPRSVQKEGPSGITAAAGPTQTYLPTHTPWPTYTPYPTPTEGRLPTGTPRPTYTSYPTQPTPAPIVKLITWTPVPTPTEPEVTPQDSVLEVGEWWKQDDVWLRVADVELSEHGSIHMGLELWNRTGQMLLFEWSPQQNTRLTDNSGNKYEESCRGMATEKYLVAERRNLFMPGCGESTDSRGDGYFGSSVTELTLVMTDISRIDRAEFRIPVPI